MTGPNPKYYKGVTELVADNPNLAEYISQLENMEFRTTLMCRIFGHKWWVTSFKERIDENEIKHRDATHYRLAFCDRCGIRNPGFRET